MLAQIIGKCKTRGGESGDKEAMSELDQEIHVGFAFPQASQN